MFVTQQKFHFSLKQWHFEMKMSTPDLWHNLLKYFILSVTHPNDNWLYSLDFAPVICTAMPVPRVTVQQLLWCAKKQWMDLQYHILTESDGTDVGTCSEVWHPQYWGWIHYAFDWTPRVGQPKAMQN